MQTTQFTNDEQGSALLKRLPRQFLVRFHIFRARASYYFWRQGGGRAVLVPARRLQPVPHKLLVVRGLRPAWLILIRGPEAAAVGGQDFVDENQVPLVPAPFEFRVR